MLHPLFDVERIDAPPGEYLHHTGEIFAVFDAKTQDSGNVSYGVELRGQCYFIKTAGNPEDGGANLHHNQRVDYLLNAAALGQSCNHPVLPRLYKVMQSPHGPMLVYAWASGELLHSSRVERDNPQSAFQRFKRLPVEKILFVLNDIYELHVQLVQQNWIAVDFYDGCLIYDFDTDKLHVVDLDMYHRGSFVNTIGRMFGSSRFMAPEEFTLNSRIDVQTTVYTMGRTAAVLLSDGTLSRVFFRGSGQLLDVISQACAEARKDRYKSMGDFYRAWCAAQF